MRVHCGKPEWAVVTGEGLGAAAKQGLDYGGG